MDLEKFKKLLEEIKNDEEKIDDGQIFIYDNSFNEKRRELANRKQGSKSSGEFTITWYEYNKLYSHVSIYENLKFLKRVNLFKDIRFQGCEWLKYFDANKVGSKIPESTFNEILNWCERITKLKMFL